MGVGNGNQTRTHDCTLPIAMSRGNDTTVLVADSELPGLLGFQNCEEQQSCPWHGESTASFLWTCRYQSDTSTWYEIIPARNVTKRTPRSPVYKFWEHTAQPSKSFEGHCCGSPRNGKWYQSWYPPDEQDKYLSEYWPWPMTNTGASTRVVQSAWTNTYCFHSVVQQSLAQRATVACRHKRRMSLARICKQLGYEHKHVFKTETSLSMGWSSTQHIHTNIWFLASLDQHGYSC